jgi:5-methylcytosine-specific restriction endonuclease McrA
MKLKSIGSRLGKAGERIADGGSWRSDKRTSGARGYTYEWQRYRAQYLAEHPMCRIKGKGCEIAASVVDHIKPHRGDMVLFWDQTNHQAACAHCHNAHKQKSERKG